MSTQQLAQDIATLAEMIPERPAPALLDLQLNVSQRVIDAFVAFGDPSALLVSIRNMPHSVQHAFMQALYLAMAWQGASRDYGDDLTPDEKETLFLSGVTTKQRMRNFVEVLNQELDIRTTVHDVRTVLFRDSGATAPRDGPPASGQAQV